MKKNGEDRMNTEKTEGLRRKPLNDPELAERMERRAARREAMYGGEGGSRAASSQGETRTVRETSTAAREASLQRSSMAERPEQGKAAQVDAASYAGRDVTERRSIHLARPVKSAGSAETAGNDTVRFEPVRVKEREAPGAQNAPDSKDKAMRSRGKAKQSHIERERAESGTVRGAKQTDEKKPGFFKKNAKPLLIAAIAVCAALIIFASYMFLSEILEYKKNNDAYDAIENKYTSTSINETASEADRVYKTYNVDFKKLSDELGSEVSRWILFEDSVINYPIAYGTDNKFYVNHLADGTEGKNGAIFIDYRNDPDFSNRNTLIYGHHMKDGSMFAELVKYARQDYMDEHPNFYILTPDESYEAQIFSAFITPSDSDVFKIAFNSDSEFDSYLQYVGGLSKVVTGVQPEISDKIVTLVTCTYEYNDARFIVQARLKPLSGMEDSQ